MVYPFFCFYFLSFSSPKHNAPNMQLCIFNSNPIQKITITYTYRMYKWKCAREQNVWALRLSEIYRSLYKAKCQTSILLFVWLPTHYFFSLWMASWNGTLGNIEKGLKKRNEWPATIKLVSMEVNHFVA